MGHFYEAPRSLLILPVPDRALCSKGLDYHMNVKVPIFHLLKKIFLVRVHGYQMTKTNEALYS